ncbi:MAG: site-specific DNA-methyltransferase [Spiroplasmataceae bacterium]|nr:site-specific DNA-methyltransferase [Spiroplasmataceae bacterium]
MLNKYLLNTKQEGEGWEMLTNLANSSVDLVILDPQYQTSKGVSWTNYPTHIQGDYEIMEMIKEINRVLKPNAFCLLWVNKTILSKGKVALWLVKANKLRNVDLLTWHKNRIALGHRFRNISEFAFLLQKEPANIKSFSVKNIPNVWTEAEIPIKQRNHPHQKPKELLKQIILATTQEQGLVVEPCAGSFILLDICQELNRNYLGVDLTYRKMAEFINDKYHRKKPDTS